MSARLVSLVYFFFNDTATTEIYTLSLHDALPISGALRRGGLRPRAGLRPRPDRGDRPRPGAGQLTAVLRLDDVTVRYGGTTALAGVGLEVGPGERVAVVGASGAGKSTLLGVANGLVPPTTGTVRVLGADPAALSGR